VSEPDSAPAPRCALVARFGTGREWRQDVCFAVLDGERGGREISRLRRLPAGKDRVVPRACRAVCRRGGEGQTSLFLPHRAADAHRCSP
jgi:hypothetical protein